MALKLTEFFFRKPGMSSEDFLTHWQQEHTGVVSAIVGLRRYVQNPAAGLLQGDTAPYDGMVEVWFDDAAAIEAVQKSDYWETIVEDELRFVDRPTMQLFVSEEALPMRPEAGFKCVTLLERGPGRSEAAFRAAAQAPAAALALPGLRSVQRILPADLMAGIPACADAMEIWRFESRAALEAGMKSDNAASYCAGRDAWARVTARYDAEERVIR